MNKFQAAWHYVEVISPWLIASFIPSLCVGLSKYPKAVTGLHFIMDALSILSHKDSPGTFKPPGLPSKPPEVVGSEIKTEEDKNAPSL